MKRPFFSVVIPTYNRSKMLKIAINSILLQTFKNFEIVVSDNCSKDNTKNIVSSFYDNRIVYIRNNTNIGAMNNIKMALSKAEGKYIVTLGDDDVVLFPDTFQVLTKLIQKEGYGFIRLNYLAKNRGNSKIMNIPIAETSNISLKKNYNALSIIKFLERINVGFFSGLIFKNEKISKNDFILSEHSPWIKLLFRLTEKYGAKFINNQYIIASWSEGDISKIYTIDEKGRLYFENYYDCVIKLLDKRENNKYKNMYFLNFNKGLVYFFPALKCFTGNQNLNLYKKKLLILNKNFEKNLYFYFYYYLSICLPRNIILLIRKYIYLIRPDSIYNIKTIKNITEINQIYSRLCKL